MVRCTHTYRLGHCWKQTVNQSMTEREKGEKRDSIVQALGKVTVFPRKDQVQVSRETNPKTSRQTLAKQTQPHVWVRVCKNYKEKHFPASMHTNHGEEVEVEMCVGVLSAEKVQCQTTDKKKLGFVLFRFQKVICVEMPQLSLSDLIHADHVAALVMRFRYLLVIELL